VEDLVTDRAKYERGWRGGLPETKCGAGSRLRNTALQREWLSEVVWRYQIESIADLGAGDLNWLQHTDLRGVAYQGYDLVPRHKDVRPFDLLADPIPEADCLWCIWVLNHFPEREAQIALGRMLNSGARFLVYTYEPRMWEFTDLEALESIVIRKRNDSRGNVEMRLVKC
jgi:hypothetical protein